MSSNGPIPVAVLGATGSVGQRFISLLGGHPGFRVAVLGASESSAGRPYAEVVSWSLDADLDSTLAQTLVGEVHPVPGIPLVFSALDAAVAKDVERAWAEAGALVVSNTACHRMDPRVPLLVPEVNADHLALLEHQPWQGGIISGPNCSTVGLALALAPLQRAFGIRRVHVVTLQALSGAGLGPVPGMQEPGNLLPHIAGEEQKMAQETAKILGRLEGNRIVHAGLTVSAQCNRVSVRDGHTECVSLELERPATREEILGAWAEFSAEPQALNLWSAPERPVHYLEEECAPQPLLHRDLDKGMACSVGRLQECPVLGWKFVCLSHNTLRGAAGGALLSAELACAQGYLASARPV
jgi:aspartate-semialdehyde dehydrogenase